MARGQSLIYGGRLSVDDLLGAPDLLRRENAQGRYVAIDSRLLAAIHCTRHSPARRAEILSESAINSGSGTQRILRILLICRMKLI
jgi:hypothetical protein